MDLHPADACRYQPLPDDSIRILSLLPSSDPTATISCGLTTQSLTELSADRAQPGDEAPHSPTYEALSYVWGTEDPSHTILVDGQPLLVRSNLYDALSALRLPDSPRTLWVDSICINQDDIAERNAQVKLMRNIYASARQVAVWLGPGDGDTDAALEFIQKLESLDPAIAARLADRAWDTDVAEPLLSWEDRTKVFGALGMKHSLDNHEEVIAGLIKLRECAWWKRIWTVQEIVLARSATLRCGRRTADWSHLAKLAAFAFDVAHYNTLNEFGGRPMVEGCFDEITWPALQMYGTVTRLDDLARRVRAGRGDITLEQLAWALLTRQATDPRDMVYGVLGLVTSAEGTLIEVDYGKPTAQVYASAMKAMILEHWQQRRTGPGPLHLLQNSYSERDTALPSWVPDFSTLHSFRTTTLAVSAVGSALVLHPMYTASAGADADDGSAPTFVDNDLVMETYGVSVDQVDELGAVCLRFANGRKGREEQLRDIVDRWLRLLEDTKSSKTEYSTGGSREEAFWRTVTFDLQLVDRDYFSGNPDRRDLRLPQGAPGMPPTTAAQKNKVFEGILDAPVPKTVLEKLQNRRLFITKTAGFLGLGPASMHVGDTVCVLRGSDFPVIIRPTTDDRHLYVGECYMHGIMDGEVIDAVKGGLTSWELICFA